MAITMSGILRDGTDRVLPNVDVYFVSKMNTILVLAGTEAVFKTGPDGSYSTIVNTGIYDCIIGEMGKPPYRAGEFGVFVDSKDGSLNSYLIDFAPEALAPEVVNVIRLLVAQAEKAEKGAVTSANAAATSRLLSEADAERARLYSLQSEQSAQNSATSEGKAKVSETNANLSATNAYNDMTVAVTSKDAAIEAANRAEAAVDGFMVDVSAITDGIISTGETVKGEITTLGTTTKSAVTDAGTVAKQGITTHTDTQKAAITTLTETKKTEITTKGEEVSETLDVYVTTVSDAQDEVTRLKNIVVTLANETQLNATSSDASATTATTKRDEAEVFAIRAENAAGIVDPEVIEQLVTDVASAIDLAEQASQDVALAVTFTDENKDTILLAPSPNLVKMSGLQPGAINPSSTDAVRASQLYTVMQIQTSHGDQLLTAQQDIMDIQSQIEGGVGGGDTIVIQDPNSLTIDIGRGVGGDTIDVRDSPNNYRFIQGVKAAQLSPIGMAAMTTGQGYTLETQINGVDSLTQSSADIFGGGVQVITPEGETRQFSKPTYTISGIDYTNIGAAFGAANTSIAKNITDIRAINSKLAGVNFDLITEYSAVDINIGAYSSTTFINFHNSANVARKLTGVAAGNLVAGSVYAVNGEQLYEANNKIQTLTSRTSASETEIINVKNRVTTLETESTAMGLTVADVKAESGSNALSIAELNVNLAGVIPYNKVSDGAYSADSVGNLVWSGYMVDTNVFDIDHRYILSHFADPRFENNIKYLIFTVQLVDFTYGTDTILTILNVPMTNIVINNLMRGERCVAYALISDTTADTYRPVIQVIITYNFDEDNTFNCEFIHKEYYMTKAWINGLSKDDLPKVDF